MLVFIDDSGDPGFKLGKGSSRFFVIALVIFDDELEAEKTSIAIKELRRRLKVSDLFEFKFNKANKTFRNSFLNTVKNFKFKIRAIVVKKEIIVSRYLRNAKENFYNFIVMQVLKNNGGKIKKAKLRFDSRGEKTLRNELRAYLSRELDNKNQKIFKDLKFVNSRQNTLIQLSDMAAGAVYSRYTDKDKSYLKLLTSAGRVDDLWEFN